MGQMAQMLIISGIVILFLYFFIWLSYKNHAKEIEEENIRINNFKKLYETYKIPLLLKNTTIHWTQNETRQSLTGALLYSQPKEYLLQTRCINISNKKISAIEIEVIVFNAFFEKVSSFTLSKTINLTFGISNLCSWELNNPINPDTYTVEIKRVRFEDGTIWNSDVKCIITSDTDDKIKKYNNEKN